MAAGAEEAVEYEPAAGVMLAPEVEARPWDEQLALDDASYRAQLAYLFERSPFYREKLAAAGVDSAAAAGGLAEIARLPLTEKRELRETCTPENPIGAHLCADAVRDRPDLLDERHDRHAELHPADRRRPRELGDRLGAQLRGLGRRPPASASSRPTTPGRSSPARRSPRSTGSASATSRSAPGTPSG